MGTLTSADAVKVYKESVIFNEDDPVVNKHFSENNRYPDVVVTENGSLPFKFESHDVAKANLAAFLGGEADGVAETWSSQAEHFSVEQSMEIDTIFDETWQFARVLLVGKITWSADRKNIMKISVIGEVLNPEDDDTPAVKKIPTPA